MQIIIDIPEEVKHKVYAYGLSLCPSDKEQLINAIINGKPLPKGHGRLIDADKIIKKMEEREERLKDDRSIWETAGVETALDMFGETIIEADKE